MPGAQVLSAPLVSSQGSALQQNPRDPARSLQEAEKPEHLVSPSPPLARGQQRTPVALTPSAAGPAFETCGDTVFPQWPRVARPPCPHGGHGPAQSAQPESERDRGCSVGGETELFIYRIQR